MNSAPEPFASIPALAACPEWCGLESGHPYSFEPNEHLPYQRTHIREVGKLERWGLHIHLQQWEDSFDPAAPLDPDARPELSIHSRGNLDAQMLDPVELEAFAAAMAEALADAARVWSTAIAPAHPEGDPR